MGAGRKTFSYGGDSGADHNYRFEMQQRNLGANLGGVIFMCNRSTQAECRRNLIFGLPSAHWCYVEHIKKGMPIFLYNFSDKSMAGIYRAADDGAWEINPHGWTEDGEGRTKYPAQVEVEVHRACPPLAERQFRPCIGANYFLERNVEKFKQELDKQQAAQLCAAFLAQAGTKGAAAPAAAPAAAAKPAAAAAAQPLASAGQASGSVNGGPGTSAGAGTSAAAARAGGPAGRTPGSMQEDQARVAAMRADSGGFKNGNVAAPNRALQPQQQPQQHAPAAARPATPAAAPAGPVAPSGPAAPPAGPAGTALRPGVEVLSDEITSLKSTLQPMIRQLKTAGSTTAAATSSRLQGHLDGLDEALVRCQKERSKLMAGHGAAGGAGRAPVAAVAPAAPAAAAPEHLMVLGGVFGNDTYLTSVDVYSPRANAWATGPPMPAPRAYCGVASVGSQVYVVGGGVNMAWLSSSMRLDSSTGQWAEIAPMAAPRGSLACAAVGGRVYVMGGGVDHGRYLSTCEAYDPGSNTWTEGPTMGSTRFSAAAAALAGSLFCAGGFDGKAYLRSAERLDPREGRWQALPDMRFPRGAHAMAAAHGRVFALGGFDGVTPGTGPGARAGFLPVVEAYDVRAGKWDACAPMAEARAYGAAVAVEGRLYAVGGLAERTSTRFEAYVSGVWVDVPCAPPKPRAFLGAVAVPA